MASVSAIHSSIIYYVLGLPYSEAGLAVGLIFVIILVVVVMLAIVIFLYIYRKLV